MLNIVSSPLRIPLMREEILHYGRVATKHAVIVECWDELKILWLSMEAFHLAACIGRTIRPLPLVGGTIDHGDFGFPWRLHDVRAPTDISRVVVGSRKRQSGSSMICFGLTERLSRGRDSDVSPSIVSLSHHTVQPPA
jgi:hypothetical protein